jgi:NAD(P)-dependent dehydrogenase (short-subunit alcohol dehydrogenase family)
VESFNKKLAVVTGGGSGMGRELVRQLAAEGCSVATCDLNDESSAETVQMALAGAPSGISITDHVCDVGDETQVVRFRDEVVERHRTDHVDLVFNNAGIGGGGSFVTDTRQSWERTFGVDWWGVYFCTRAFLPLLMKSDDAMLVNTSSVNGFWASLGPGVPHTAYSTAKFAVKGFTEALIEDLRVNAPHVKVAVVMPGHIGTDIVANSRRAHGEADPADMTESDLEEWRASLAGFGQPVDHLSTGELRQAVANMGEAFKRSAPLSAEGAAEIILDGVRRGAWRILVGRDAEALDAQVRADPERAYDPAKMGALLRGSLQGGRS